MSAPPDPARRRNLRERYQQIDTATIADVLDELSLGNQGLASNLRMLSGDGLAGWAYTIHGVADPTPRSGDPRKMEVCQAIGPDEVSVWSGGATGFAYFGELIVTAMAERGSVGALVDGGARDTRWLSEMGFPCAGAYCTPVQSIGRWVVDDAQVPVLMPGATSPEVEVHPGDFVRVDVDGGIVVPGALAEEVLARAEELTATEVRVRADLRAGAGLSEVLDKYGHV